MDVLIYHIDSMMYGIPMKAVKGVMPCAGVTPLRGAAESVVGMVTVRGEPAPVVDMRRALGAQPRETHPNDRLIILRIGRKFSALLVDAVSGAYQVNESELLDASQSVAKTAFAVGIAECGDGLVVIQDIDRLLESQTAEESYMMRLAA